MLKSKKFISMPVVSLEEGQQVGTIRGLVVNPTKREIAAFIIDQKGWFKDQKIIPYSRVSSVGGDAVTIDKSASVEKVTNLPEILKLIKENFEPLGAKLITEDGSVLGYIDEFEIEPTTGQIKSLEISGRLLDSLIKGKANLSMDFVRTIGKDVVIVQKEAVEALVKIDGGLQETFQNFKGTTSQFFEATIQKTKELSEKFKKENHDEAVGGEPVYQGQYGQQPDPGPDQVNASSITEISSQEKTIQEEKPQDAK